MLKPDSLRAALVAALPQYGQDPDRLAIFAEKGRIAARPGSDSFEYRYELRVALLDYSGHVDQIVLPVLRWLRVNQPELLLTRETSNQLFTFEAEILSDSTADIELLLPLTEAVEVEQRADGGTDFHHLDEPGAPDAAFAGNPVLAELFDQSGPLRSG